MILILSSIITIVTVNIAFRRGQYGLGNLYMLVMLASIFNHSSQCMDPNGKYSNVNVNCKSQLKLCKLLDRNIVYLTALVNCLVAMRKKRYDIVCIYIVVYFFFKEFLYKKEKYDNIDIIIHVFILHILGNFINLCILYN